MPFPRIVSPVHECPVLIVGFVSIQINVLTIAVNVCVCVKDDRKTVLISASLEIGRKRTAMFLFRETKPDRFQ